MDPDPQPAVDALANLSDILRTEEPIQEEALVGLAQKDISMKVDIKCHQTLLDTTIEQRDKVRLASLSLPKSGAWLHVVPSPSLGLHL